MFFQALRQSGWRATKKLGSRVYANARHHTIYGMATVAAGSTLYYGGKGLYFFGKEKAQELREDVQKFNMAKMK